MDNPPTPAQLLIDAAAQACASKAELARRLGVGRAFVSQMRSGDAPIPLCMAAQLALLAGRDPHATLAAIAVANTARNRSRRTRQK